MLITIADVSLKHIACVQKSPLPQKKSGEETIFSEGEGTSVHRLEAY